MDADGASASASASAAVAGGTSASELFDRQVDAQKLTFLNERVSYLQAENAALRERHDKREQETHEFVAYFQKEIQSRDKQVNRLSEELAALRLSHTLEMEAAHQAQTTETQALTQQLQAKDDTFSEKVFVLQEELAQLEAFKDVKDALQTKLRDTEAALRSEQEQGRERMAALERKFLEDKARLQKEHEKKIEMVKQQAKEDARNGLDADTRKIMTDNRRMGEELRFQLQMSEELQAEKQELEARANKSHLDMQLATAKEHEYAAAAQRQARELKQLRATIHDLEARMTQSVAALERERHALEVRGERELEDKSMDVDGLRRLVRLKNKELRSLRRLAQTIVDQRTDVEVFFLDALEHVKHEMETAQRQQRERDMERYRRDAKRANGGSTRFPALAAPQPQSQPQPSSVEAGGHSVGNGSGRHLNAHVDIRQLSWADKERVLRLVFAKINGIHSMADASPHEQEQTTLAADRSSPSLGSCPQQPLTTNQVESSTVQFATEPDALRNGPSAPGMGFLSFSPTPPPLHTRRG